LPLNFILTQAALLLHLQDITKIFQATLLELGMEQDL